MHMYVRNERTHAQAKNTERVCVCEMVDYMMMSVLCVRADGVGCCWVNVNEKSVRDRKSACAHVAHLINTQKLYIVQRIQNAHTHREKTTEHQNTA